MRVSCTPLTPRRLLWRWRTVGHFRYIFSFKVCKWVRCFAECCCKCGLTILLCSQIIWDWRPGSSEKGSPKRGSVRVYCFSGARHKGLACLRSSQEKATGSSVVAATSWPSNCAGTSYSFLGTGGCVVQIQHRLLLFDSQNFRLEDNESADIKSCLHCYFLMKDTFCCNNLYCKYVWTKMNDVW